MEDQRWTVTLAGKDVILRDQFTRILKAIQSFRELGSNLTRLDPIHAGLPWAGICFVMELAVSGTDQYAAMVSAVDEVSTLLFRYQHVEYICHRRRDVALQDDFEELLVKLYKHILKFQVSAACYYRRSKVWNFLRAIPKLDNVAEILGDIWQADAACTALGVVLGVKDEILRHSELLTLLRLNKEAFDRMS